MDRKRILLICSVVFFLIFVSVKVYESIDGPRTKEPSFKVAVDCNQEKSGWYYSIYYGGKLLIRQDFIPGIPQKKAFAKRSDAEKIGNLVAERLKMGEPPTVSTADLKKYGISF